MLDTDDALFLDGPSPIDGDACESPLQPGATLLAAALADVLPALRTFAASLPPNVTATLRLDFDSRLPRMPELCVRLTSDCRRLDASIALLTRRDVQRPLGIDADALNHLLREAKRFAAERDTGRLADDEPFALALPAIGEPPSSHRSDR